MKKKEGQKEGFEVARAKRGGGQFINSGGFIQHTVKTILTLRQSYQNFCKYSNKSIIYFQQNSKVFKYKLKVESHKQGIIFDIIFYFTPNGCLILIPTHIWDISTNMVNFKTLQFCDTIFMKCASFWIFIVCDHNVYRLQISQK